MHGGISRQSAGKAEKETKVDAYLKVVAATTGLLPAPHIHAEFYLFEDGRTLYLKNGTRVTQLKDSTKYLSLKSIGSADYISTHYLLVLISTYYSAATTERTGLGLYYRLDYTNADCCDSERCVVVFMRRHHGAAGSLWMVWCHIYGLVFCH